MRIAQICSNFIRLPPEYNFIPLGFSGAAEAITWELTDQLVKRGHEVTLFASGDSQTTAKLESITEISTSKMENVGREYIFEMEHLLINHAYKLAKTGRFDIIHSQMPSRTAFYADFSEIPTVATLHSPLDGHSGLILNRFKNSQHYVSISNAQRTPLADMNFAATIYHGINLQDYPFNNEPGEYLLYIGRINRKKGTIEAIEAAKASGKPLVIMGCIDETRDEFFLKEVKPFIDNSLIRYEGYVERKRLIETIRGAKALLFPIKWNEPFGLAMIEAMACGTPVIAFANGSVSEVVKDGVTGFIVSSDRGVEGLVEAIKNINSMGAEDYKGMRINCRKHIEENFSLEKMVDNYEEVYRKILSS
ncbi:hypothetical protein A2W14_04630 [Candidatus Gottesmanbacteria bacterium RBG_16_37_8]|uniref:Glycosyl transferase n=1 Tax=Candidatus Gottesmanbacteria bacterium RBG_16_37_8 TaxID=1798371 RepID=A0A1F5YSR7_9BACT|nr:MAG: hypothetical protein A2W14_04630 [Candidatus Gottesmanbacteria bacterium RBG_16_37_8]